MRERKKRKERVIEKRETGLDKEKERRKREERKEERVERKNLKK